MTRRPAKLRAVTAGGAWRLQAASTIEHGLQIRALVSGFLRQLAHTAVFDRISLPFIVRVVPSKYASLIGKGLNFYPLLAELNKSGPILDLSGSDFGALDF